MKIVFVVNQTWFFCIAISWSFCALSQNSDTLLNLNTVLITTPRIQTDAGAKSVQLDSALLTSLKPLNIADALSQLGQTFIKNYGSGMLATSSIRGASASQTQVLWNGFSLISPMNGMVDLNTLPLWLFDDISLEFGGASGKWGSGAVGGTIALNTKPEFNKSITLNVGSYLGSFNQQRYLTGVTMGKENYYFKLKSSRFSADNNFTYQNILVTDSPFIKQTHNNLLQESILAEAGYKTGKNQVLTIGILMQNGFREIPPTMLTAVNGGEQKDETLKSYLSYKYYFLKHTVTLRTSLFYDRLVYTNQLFENASDNRCYSNQNEAEWEYQGEKNFKFSASFIQVNNYAKVVDYTANIGQHKNAIFIRYSHQVFKKFIIQPSIRAEMVNRKLIPLVYGISTSFNVTKFISVKAQSSRVYRLPTLNDLYWKTGGNPDLKPEQGFAHEAGIVLTKSLSSKITFNTECTYFLREVKDWIIWLPGQYYWTPRNIMQVKSHGAETNSRLTFSSVNFKLTQRFNTSYVISVNQKSYWDYDQSVGMQLIYTPLYQASSATELNYRKAGIRYQMSYSGYRFISTDNQDYLLPYYMHTISFGYPLKLKMITTEFSFNIFNFLNTQYQAIASRPMPGRNFQIGVVINYKK